MADTAQSQSVSFLESVSVRDPPICTSVVLWRSVGGVRRTRRSARMTVCFTRF